MILSLINIIAAIGLTAYRLVVVAKDDPENSDFTFTILIIVNAGMIFCDIHYFVTLFDLLIISLV